MPSLLPNVTKENTCVRGALMPNTCAMLKKKVTPLLNIQYIGPSEGLKIKGSIGNICQINDKTFSYALKQNVVISTFVGVRVLFTHPLRPLPTWIRRSCIQYIVNCMKRGRPHNGSSKRPFLKGAKNYRVSYNLDVAPNTRTLIQK